MWLVISSLGVVRDHTLGVPTHVVSPPRLRSEATVTPQRGAIHRSGGR